jgi:outer membrane protein assembly factor BamB
MKRFLLLFPLLALPFLARAEDAPQFRGPGGLGVSRENNLPTQWNEKENVRWKAPLPGRGLGGAVIAGGRAYVTACSGFEQKRLHVLCFDVKTGSQLWERQLYATGTTLCHEKTNMAAPTPITNGQVVAALFATGDMVCFDKAGDLQWYRSLVGDYPTVGNNVGMAGSPVLWKDTAIVCLENAGESFAVGIDLKTGENRWRVERPRGINWVSPLLAEHHGRSEVIFQGPADVTAHDPATGKKLWSLVGKGFGTIPSPTTGDGLIFSPGGKLQAIQAPAKLGDEPKVLWDSPRLPTGYGSPIVYEGRVYALSYQGVVNCADAASGKSLWNLRVEGTYAASPLLADGRLYVTNEEGQTSVVELGEKGNLLGTNPIGEKVLATPVAADSALFLRTDRHLWCISKAK